jgi:hypothetical protein
MKVKPRNAKVSGLLTPRFLRLTAAGRPNSITRVLTGWSDSENAANRSRNASRKRRASVSHDDHVAAGFSPSPAFGPQIENVMQVDVAEER